MPPGGAPRATAQNDSNNPGTGVTMHRDRPAQMIGSINSADAAVTNLRGHRGPRAVSVITMQNESTNRAICVLLGPGQPRLTPHSSEGGSATQRACQGSTALSERCLVWIVSFHLPWKSARTMFNAAIASFETAMPLG
jgi:hypothetical protein